MTEVNRLGRAVADALGDGPSKPRLQAQRAALVAASGHQKTTRLRGLLWASSLAMVFVAVVLSLRQLGGERQSAMPSVGGARPLLSAGAYLEAPDDRSRSVYISPGVALELHAGSKLQVQENSDHHAKLTLTRGRVTASATEASDFVWTVQTGGLASLIKDGRATIAWNPEQLMANVQVVAGVIQCGATTGAWRSIEVREGGQIEAVGERVRAKLAETGSIIELGPRATETVEPRRDDPKQPRVRTRPRRVRDVQHDWRAYFDNGDYERAMRTVKRSGWRRRVQAANAEDLRRLADLARLSGDGPRAKLALRTLQRRFPRTSDGRAADFLLGRVAMDIDRDYVAAAKFFARYVQRNPEGRLRREAQGRILDAYVKSGDRKSARRAAQDYLKDYPNGPFAGLARSLSPSE